MSSQHSAPGRDRVWLSVCGSPDSPATTTCGPIWSTTRPDLCVAHREALLLGDSFVIVWADSSAAPKVSVESAKQVAVLTDPGTRHIVAAVKRWEDRQPPTQLTPCSIARTDHPLAGRPDGRDHRLPHGRQDRQPAWRKCPMWVAICGITVVSDHLGHYGLIQRSVAGAIRCPWAVFHSMTRRSPWRLPSPRSRSASPTDRTPARPRRTW